MSETKTQDITTARTVAGLAFRAEVRAVSEKPGATPRDVAVVTDAWAAVFRSLDYAAARLSAEVEAETAPQVEPPEEVGDGEWFGWIGEDCPPDPDTTVDVVLRDGTTFSSTPASAYVWCHHTPDHPYYSRDIVRYRIVKPDEPAPPQTPAERIAAMTDEEVEAFVTDEMVWGWYPSTGAAMFRPRIDDDEGLAVTTSGVCCDPEGTPYDGKRGDTTTPAGRLACTRRLAVHLMRETVP